MRGTSLIERGPVEAAETLTLDAAEWTYFEAQFQIDKHSDWTEEWGPVKYIYAGMADTPIMVTDGAGAVTESYVGGPLGTRRMFTGPPLTTAGTVTGGGILEMPDGLGNAAVTVDGSAARLDTYTYDAFGAPNEAVPNNTLTDRFLAENGRPLDTTTNLILMGARPYDAATGRFLSVDAVEGGSANVYDYANQDPIDSADPNGTDDGGRLGDGEEATRDGYPSPMYRELVDHGEQAKNLGRKNFSETGKPNSNVYVVNTKNEIVRWAHYGADGFRQFRVDVEGGHGETIEGAHIHFTQKNILPDGSIRLGEPESGSKQLSPTNPLVPRGRYLEMPK